MYRIKLNNITKKYFSSNIKPNYLLKCKTCKYNSTNNLNKLFIKNKDKNKCTYFIDENNKYITCDKAVNTTELCGNNFTKYVEFKLTCYDIVFVHLAVITIIGVSIYIICYN